MIVAVVVTYRAPAGMLDRCIAAVRSAGGVDRIVVVDTGRSALVPAGVEHIPTDNRGYGAAANIGFARAAELGADAVVLLNDDVTVRDGWLVPLLAELAGDVGAAQPILVAADGPSVTSAGVGIGPDGAGVDITARDGLGSEPEDIAIFTGGAVALAPAFIRETGGFDERWFLYYEDVDLARRGASLGWRYRLVPASVVEHVRGTTTGADPARTRFLQERNRLWSAARHESGGTVARALWLSLRRLRHPPRRVHARALAAGVAGFPWAVRSRLAARRASRSTP